jgi:MFS family permease
VKLPLSRRLAAVYLACFAMGVGVGTSKTFVPAILVSEGRNVVAPFFIAYTAGALFQRSVFGWLPDRIGRARVTVAALLVYGVGLALVVPASVDHVSWLGVLIGIAHGAAYPASAALGAESCAVSQRGRVSAWSTGFFNLGIAIANSVVVLLEGPLGYRGLMAVGAGILWFICGLVRWLVGSDRSRSVAE